MFPAYPYVQRPVAQSSLQPSSCRLTFRQEPNEALVTLEGKEKARKPVDPPPILELEVSEQEDPRKQYLQSPYLFVCTSLFKADKDEPVESSGDKTLAGTLVSSLHRLKDISNKDGGFFVFGDISIKLQGSFRLHFTLYNFLPDTNEMQCLAAATSIKFKVLPAKDFKGMDESTYLSRAFSDQGVRLRLRKEPRGLMGNKRTFNQYETFEDESSPKRKKQEIEISPYPPAATTASYSNPAPSMYPTATYSPAPTTQYTMPPTNTYGMPSTTTHNLSPNNAHGMTMNTTPSIPPHTTHGIPPQTTHGIPPHATHGLPPHTTHGMPPNTTNGMSPHTSYGLPFFSSNSTHQYPNQPNQYFW
ncbi:hypothetical protein ACN47E_003864 [Coniothyrium glycines]